MAKKDNNPATKSISKEKQQFAIGIKVKLVIGFAIPLVFTIVIGMVAYSLAASGMTKNYEDSMSKAMSMAIEYLDFGFSSAVSESEQLYYDTDLMRWATGAIYNEWTRKEVMNDVSLDLNIKQGGNEFVANMYIIPGSSSQVISTNGDDAVVPGFYEELADKDEAVCLQTLEGSWVGAHNYIDQVLSQHYTGYSADDYACSFIRPMATKRACIVVDYSSDSIAGVLQNLGLGEDSIAAFVTADGRELLLKEGVISNSGDFSFVNQPYFTEAMADNAATIIDYVTYNSQQYLFMVSKSYQNGSAICAMVPVSLVNESADSIKKVTLLMVIISWLVAIAAGVLITIGITATIRQISSKLETVSGGDLTVSMRGRTDEFKLLVRSIVNMIKNSRDLIVQVLKTTENVTASTANLSEASGVLTNSSNQISAAVDEMDQGLNRQAEDAQNCLMQMDELSQRITRAVETVQRMGSITDNTKDVIASGMSTMDDLTDKSAATTDITKNVTTNIKNLEESLSAIEKFVETIDNIANETSLLSLNASIEAARAGEAGRGFAVVAQSVSSLSIGTIEAARQIQSVMEQIRGYANDTVQVASQAEMIVSNQSETVNDTIQVFHDMNEYLQNLIDEISSLNQTIESMERHRNDTLAAIESISSVSEETAASVSTVNDSLKEQMTMMDNLNQSTIELQDRAKELTQAVNAFKI
ncbi:MAG: hypothetical protein HDR30_09620 [Lachnospiraceae bacterium]|nr:hypothetical protein [Lachnospiraceae bacterium]